MKKILIAVLLLASVPAFAQSLGAAAQFGALAAASITCTGASTIDSAIGTYAGTSITGFPTPCTVSGPTHNDDTTSQAGIAAAQAAYTYYSGLTPTVGQTGLSNLSTNDGGGGAGVYHAGVFSGGALSMPTGITLDAQGVSSAVFVFQAASTVNLATGQSVTLTGGALSQNVYWAVGSTLTTVDPSTMVGTIIASTSVTLGGGVLDGQAFALTGSVTIAAALEATNPNFVTLPTGVISNAPYWWGQLNRQAPFLPPSTQDVVVSYGLTLTDLSNGYALIPVVFLTPYATVYGAVYGFQDMSPGAVPLNYSDGGITALTTRGFTAVVAIPGKANLFSGAVIQIYAYARGDMAGRFGQQP